MRKLLLRGPNIGLHVLLPIMAATLVLAGCNAEPEQEDDPPIRGLLAVKVDSTEGTTTRRYPGVLEPTEITALSFEVAGKVGEISLSVGQRVSADDVLAQLDSTQFEVEIDNRQAAVEAAEAVLAQDTADLERQETLLARGAGTQLSVDEARTDFLTSTASLTQAQQALASAIENLEETTLLAPFDGIVNSVDANSFATVGAGTAITSIYDASSYEVSFSVNFETVARLVVGTPAVIRLADDPSVTLDAVISELGERADTVSSFPVVVELREANPIIRAGMAVEVSFEFELPSAQGFLIPLSAAIVEGEAAEDASPNAVVDLEMYVFDEATSTVKRRAVKMGGIRENKLLIIDGLEAGEFVAVAGVSFLRDGMEVSLLETEQ